ncbi:hypothetical protein DPMN_180292 [Dreissena polymorpha]|uniref:Mutator-like transposase domain-containing protein n=1 Tax=Dreissena polymorpha TaxID=45954 RepID=A0A9D4ILI8_DREPO|nr:hypothetical protein DPMN_180292 [Dreissena polymorpha]
MEAVANQETLEVQAGMTDLIEDLGVCPFPNSLPALKHTLLDIPEDDDWTDIEEDEQQNSNRHKIASISPISQAQVAVFKARQKGESSTSTQVPLSYKMWNVCCSRHSLAKKGFDSLTSHTFFMSTDKSARQKKVVKAIVGHRLCGVCSWWRRNKPGQKVRPQRCVRNHTGSARAMEATSGVKGVKELSEQGTPVEYLEGDGDNTLISKLKSDLYVQLKLFNE